jgi:hypothetical protein
VEASQTGAHDPILAGGHDQQNVTLDNLMITCDAKKVQSATTNLELQIGADPQRIGKKPVTQ